MIEKVVFMNMCMISDNKGNVLALDKVGKNYSGTTFPGGHVEAGETFIESVIREVFEETKKEGDYMCEALRELFSDEIEAEKARARREGLEEGREEGIAEGRAEERAESQSVIFKLQEQIEMLNQTVSELKKKLSKLEEA